MSQCKNFVYADAKTDDNGFARTWVGPLEKVPEGRGRFSRLGPYMLVNRRVYGLAGPSLNARRE